MRARGCPWRAWRASRAVAGGFTANFGRELKQYDYESQAHYEDVQVRSSTCKSRRDNQDKHAAMLRLVDERLFSGMRILCLGARNENELRAFRELAEASSLELGGLVGIDLSAPPSETAAVRHGDMMALDFPDDSQDLVYAHHSLEHTRDPRCAAAEILRVVRPGGLVFVTVPFKLPLDELECVSFESYDDLIELFGAGLAEIRYLRRFEPGEDLAEEVELRFLFRAR